MGQPGARFFSNHPSLSGVTRFTESNSHKHGLLTVPAQKHTGKRHVMTATFFVRPDDIKPDWEKHHQGWWRPVATKTPYCGQLPVAVCFSEFMS